MVVFNDIEDRMRADELLREHEEILAAQQAALRRVAMLVAGGATSADVFAAIAKEVGLVIGLPLVAVWRYETDGTASVVGAWSDRPHPFEVGTRWPLDGPTICARILETGRPATIDDFRPIPGTIADAARETGIRACAGAPIFVDGALWGAMSTDSTDGAPLPDDIEDRLVEFTELVAATFSTTARQEELARLADEQAGLRRVATLVAQGVPAEELFAAVTEEVGRLLGADAAATIRYEPGGMLSAVGSWTAEGVDAETEVGRQFPLTGESLAPRILKTGRPARIDDWRDVPGAIGDYVRTRMRLSSSVGSPIVVEGRVWGNLVVHSTTGRSRATRRRASRASPSSWRPRSSMRRRGPRWSGSPTSRRRCGASRRWSRASASRRRSSPRSPRRWAGCCRVESTAMLRYEDDGTTTVVASWGGVGDSLAVGTRLPLGGENVTTEVHRTGRPARIEEYATATGALGTPHARAGHQLGGRVPDRGRRERCGASWSPR